MSFNSKGVSKRPPPIEGQRNLSTAASFHCFHSHFRHILLLLFDTHDKARGRNRIERLHMPFIRGKARFPLL